MKVYEGKTDRVLSISEKIILRLISSVLAVAVINMLSSEQKWSTIRYVTDISTPLFVMALAAVFTLITAVDILFTRLNKQNTDALIFVVVSVSMGFYMLIGGKDIYLTVIVVFLVIAAVCYVLSRFPAALMSFSLSRRQLWIIFTFFMVTTLVYVGSLVVLRYYLFRTPNFDFGIFSQMYYYMKETGLPMTTCERGFYLSHFAIHFSPVFYILLPIYMIFPHPVTLIVLQLLIVMSGVIPVYMICRYKKYSNLVTLGLMLTFILYPCMRSGLFYDFHENKLLVPLLLWLLYFLECRTMTAGKRNAGIVVFMLMSLMVKEDAAIYVACIGLFWLAYQKEKKEKLRGLFILIASVLYFLVVFKCLNTFGSGSAINSIGRYDNLMVTGEDGLTGMLMNILKNPAYAIKQLMKAEKLEFVLWTMLPLLFVPLLVKRISMYILMIPYMVINLLTNYGYQFDIGFQYTYGSCTLLIYLAILYFDGAETLKKKKCIIVMAAAAFLMTSNAIAGKNIYYGEAKTVMDKNMEIMELLETIPEDAAVTADTWFVPALSQRREVYEYSEKRDIITEFVVLDQRSQSAEERNKTLVAKLEQEGYETFAEIKDMIVILKVK